MRLIEWPIGLTPISITPTTGPDVIGSTETIGRFAQTVERPTSLVGYDFEFAPARAGREAREFEGLSTDLAKGANAVRIPFRHPDEPTWAERGLVGLPSHPCLNWSNGKPWSNGLGWRCAPPMASVNAAAAYGATVVKIDVTKWADVVGRGLRFGFVGHFGVYMVRSASLVGHIATVRIFPSLRRAITAGQMVTLRPVICMRLASANGATATRVQHRLDGLSLSLIEVEDATIRAYAL